MEENSSNKVFNKGLLMAVIGWLLTVITSPIAMILLAEGRIDFSNFMDSFVTIFALIYGGVLLIIWVPAAWIISRAYRVKGHNKALLLTVAVYAISLLIFFGCTGTL